MPDDSFMIIKKKKKKKKGCKVRSAYLHWSHRLHLQSRRTASHTYKQCYGCIQEKLTSTVLVFVWIKRRNGAIHLVVQL